MTRLLTLWVQPVVTPHALPNHSIDSRGGRDKTLEQDLTDRGPVLVCPEYAAQREGLGTRRSQEQEDGKHTRYPKRVAGVR